MTNYRIRLKNGRVIGPFSKDQLFELKSKGHIAGKEEAQVFPMGDWRPISSFDFYSELMDENKTIINRSSKDETFVLDLGKLKAQKNEKEVDKMDLTSHPLVEEVTQTVQLKTEEKKVPPPPEPKPAPQAEVSESHEKTLINPKAQEELQRLRVREQEEARKLQEEIERKRQEQEKSKEIKPVVIDESTQMIRLDNVGDVLAVAEEEEKKIEIEFKSKQKKKIEAIQEDEDEDTEDEEPKKKFKLLFVLGALALLYVIMFPEEEKPKAPPFQHLPPQIVFPLPFDKADSGKSQADYEVGRQLFAEGTYPKLIKAGLALKSSYENNIDNGPALSLLVRVYAEELKYSKDNLEDAQVVFNLIQSKRPYLLEDPNGVIGINLFYMSIKKYEAAADVVAKYLKLRPENVTQDLFAVYLMTLIKIGRVDTAKQFVQALLKAPKQNRYSYEALIEYFILNQESEKALSFVDQAIKDNTQIVSFYLEKCDLLIAEKKFKEVASLLSKVEALNLEYNDINRAKYLEVKGLLFAHEGKVKEATEFLDKSLKLSDSTDLRLKLAELSSQDEVTNETEKLIAESKSVKHILTAKDFFEKKNYEQALSSAAKATDAFPGYIPAELFLAKVQLKLGLAKQALKTIEALVAKYPEDKMLNFALIDAYIETYKFNDAKNRIAIISGTPLKNTYEFASANARLNMKMGDSLLAISWFKSSTGMNPLNDQDMYLLADIFIKKANFDAAKSLLNKCMELDPVNPDYRIAYAKIIYERQDDQAAIGYLLGLLKEFGENPKFLSEIAIFYFRAGKVKDFEAYKQRIEKLPGRDKALYEFLIKAALLDERYDDVPTLVENLLQVEPGDIESMMTAGRVMFESGKLDKAVVWFERVQSKLDTYPKVHYYLARIRLLSKRYEEAVEEVQKDLKANGENDSGLALLGEIHAEKGELIEAENYFKKAQKLNHRSYDALMGLADISTKRNNFDQALDLYKKAMKEKSDEPIIHKKIGDVYRLLGQGSLAIESYKLYLEMNPEAPDKNQIESYINLMQ